MKELLTFNVSEDTPVPNSDGQIGRFTCRATQKITSSFSGSSIVIGDSSELGSIAVKIHPTEHGVRREWDRLNRAFSAKIQVPQPICLAFSDEGEMVLVSKRIVGKNLYSDGDTDRFTVLGSTIKSLQNRIAVAGEEWRQSGCYDFSYYERRLAILNDTLIDDHLNDSQVKSLLNSYASEVSGAFPDTKPVFTHHDIHNDQILVTENGQLYLLDFEKWVESHPFNDIAIYLYHTLRTLSPIDQYEMVVKGYSPDRPLLENERMMVFFFLLLMGVNSVEYYKENRKKELPYAVEYLRRSVAYTEQQTT